MGRLRSFIGKAKGVMGRVLNGVAKYAPKVGGVMGKIGQYTGIPIFNWISNIAKGAGGVANAIKNKDYSTATDTIKHTIGDASKNKTTIRDNIDKAKDFVRGKILPGS